jgi:hypothetical protein
MNAHAAGPLALGVVRAAAACRTPRHRARATRYFFFIDDPELLSWDFNL